MTQKLRLSRPSRGITLEEWIHRQVPRWLDEFARDVERQNPGVRSLRLERKKRKEKERRECSNQLLTLLKDLSELSG